MFLSLDLKDLAGRTKVNNRAKLLPTQLESLRHDKINLNNIQTEVYEIMIRKVKNIVKDVIGLLLIPISKPVHPIRL